MKYSSDSIYYFELAILKSAISPLTYYSDIDLNIGQLVKVPLKGRLKEAVILKSTKAPEFETKSIDEVLELFYYSWQMDTAKFISQYYFCSLGEALGLFIPFSRENSSNSLNNSLSQSPIRLPKLSPLQKNAYEALCKEKKALLFGVTGSGKTELYIHRIEYMLKIGKSTILLMPEISLTPQMQNRLKSYFGDRVALWHSALSKKRKEEILAGIRDSKILIVAGARSALFVPIENLGLIIVDEEHDDSYKSMRRPRYNARDLAIYLAKKRQAQIFVASATPSLNSYLNLPIIRLKEPYIKTKKSYQFISGTTINTPILKTLEENYIAKEQSLVFVPTRANFKYLWCESCGQTYKCPYCSVGMSLYRRYKHLRCQYCHYTEPIVEVCPNCGYAPMRSNRIGTEEVIGIIKEAIPKIRVEQFDKEAISTPTKLLKALKRIESGECDVIVGTQMLSKGHDYPNITLSVIIGLDYLIGLGDYRAKERAIALLHQIAGRSGRSKDAKILIQTNQAKEFSPWLKDYEDFLKEELEFRKIANYPPFVRLARLIISNKNEKIAKDKSCELANILDNIEGVELIGYGVASIAKIANRYRYSVLLRSKNPILLLRAIHLVSQRGIEIDMDPIDFS